MQTGIRKAVGMKTSRTRRTKTYCDVRKGSIGISPLIRLSIRSLLSYEELGVEKLR